MKILLLSNRPMKYLTLLAVVFCFSTGNHFAEESDQPKIGNLKGADLSLMNNHDPEAERANFQLLPGYEVNLFASEPMLANPIHMVWDSRGRLWVACSWSYPQLKPGEKANDKIIILEDTNGDGKADKSTVFAEGLYMPTGIELANGGCYVSQSPDVFFFKDTDGDDVADFKELALTGFGIEDSHHSISAWRRGPGGWIYFQEGIFLHSQIETQHGMVRNFNGGVYQYNPKTQELKIFAKVGVGNPWGHVFNRWGQSFLVDNPRINYLSPSTGNSGEKVQSVKLIQTEKQCGGDLASGSHLPEDIRGQLLTCRFKSRTVIRYEFIEDGAGFSANVLEPLIASKHPNFRPVDCKIGPDGAIYVADWYNSIINHANHNFRDPRRDHTHGRIWRITAKGRPLVKKPQFERASITQLLDYLKSPEAWVRQQARYEISLKNPDHVLGSAESWVKDLDPKDPDYDHHLVEAMWACQNANRVSESILNRVLTAKDGHARAAGARVIRYWHDQLPNPVAMIGKLADDPFPRARMEAILSAGFIPKAEAFPAMLMVLDHKRDKFINTALDQTIAALESYWKPALSAGKLEFAKDEHRQFAEREAGIGFDKYLVEFLQKDNPSPAEVADIKERLLAGGQIKHVQKVIGALATKSGVKSRVATLALLDALQKMDQRGKGRVSRKLLSLKSLLSDEDTAIAAGVAGVFGIWKVHQIAPDLLALVSNDRSPRQARLAAAIALGAMERGDLVRKLKKLATSGSVESRYYAVIGLVQEDVKSAAVLAAKLLVEDPGEADPVVLVKGFLNRSKGDVILRRSIRGVKLHPVVMDKVAAFHRQSGQLPATLEKLFQTTPTRSLSAALMAENRAKLVADVNKLGDPARGEKIYRRKAIACTSCHGMGSIGPEIGPNLAAVGTAAPVGYMVESILEPNKSIAEHFENMMITLTDGSVRMGVITFKSSKEVVIRDSAQGGKEVRIPVDKIKKSELMPSLMPAGLADQLENRQEFLDLTKFLSVLGQPGPYANNEKPMIRKWRLVVGKEGELSLPADDAAWIPAYSMVDGELPVSDLDLGSVVYARGFVNVQVAGAVTLSVGETKGLSLWVDGERIDDLTKPINLSQGRHSLTFAIDRAQRGQVGLKVEVLPAAGSKAKFKPEGGI